jgi:hypothetical protein
MSLGKVDAIKADLNHSRAEDFFHARFFASSGPAINRNRNNLRGRERKNHMSPLLFKFKKLTPLCLIVFAVGSIAVLPKVRAACGSPDPGCPVGNLAEGYVALAGLTTGTYNTGIGAYSLLSLTDANFCTGVGAGTLFSNTAIENTATGAGALFSNTAGFSNTANGAFALFSNSTGDTDTATGDSALLSNTTGTNNTATGATALSTNNVGNGNTAVGSGALGLNSTGNQNTATGSGALINNTTGSSNIALGVLAGTNLTTGDNNIDIGNSGVADESSTIRIGEAPSQTATFIAGISGTAVVGDPVVVDANGQLGTATSSARFKKDIQPMDKRSEAILSFKPVSFQYKSDNKGTPQFGLIAEDVAKVNPDLVVRDRNGDIYSVRYEAVNAMLLNEFLKEHKAFMEEQRTVEELKREVAALTAGLQKVSAQLEATKPATQVADSN